MISQNHMLDTEELVILYCFRPFIYAFLFVKVSSKTGLSVTGEGSELYCTELYCTVLYCTSPEYPCGGQWLPRVPRISAGSLQSFKYKDGHWKRKVGGGGGGLYPPLYSCFRDIIQHLLSWPTIKCIWQYILNKH